MRAAFLASLPLAAFLLTTEGATWAQDTPTAPIVGQPAEEQEPTQGREGVTRPAPKAADEKGHQHGGGSSAPS